MQINSELDSTSPPPMKPWSLWRHFLTYGLTLDRRELLSPLGRWYKTQRHFEHENIYCPKYNEVYIKQWNEWMVLQQSDQDNSLTDTGKTTYKRCVIPVNIKKCNENTELYLTK